MEQRDEAAVPVGVVEVHGVDALVREGGGAALRSFFDLGQAGRVDQPNALPAQREQRAPVGRAQPDPIQHGGRHLACDVDDALAGRHHLHVERQVEPIAAVFVQFGESGDVRRQIATVHLADRTTAEATTDDAVVIEHDVAVGGEPHIALEPGCAESQTQGERLEGVLRRMCASPTMGERDRFVEDRRQPLLHPVSVPADAGGALASSPRLRDVFNFSGSEIVFLLLLALIILGPEKLPEAVRKFGKTYAELKKMSNGFQSELKQALDEPMREMRETADAFKKAASFDVDLDPRNLLKPDTTDPAAPNADAAPADAPPAGSPPAEAVPVSRDEQKPFEQTVISGGSRPAAPVREPGLNFASAAPPRRPEPLAPADDAPADDAPAEDAPAEDVVAADVVPAVVQIDHAGAAPPLAPRPDRPGAASE